MNRSIHHDKSAERESLFSKDHPAKILYVDDNEDHLLLVKEWLCQGRKERRVDGVCSAEEAFELLKRHSFDLILLDYKLGEVDGLEILKQLKLQGIRSPIVMLTGQGDEHTAVQAIKWGAKDYVCKGGANLGELLKVVQDILKDHEP